MTTDRTHAILLFTAHLSKDTDGQYKPLSLTEWNKFVRWSQTKNLNPEDFLTGDTLSLLEGWNDQQISKNHLSRLLDRKTALAIAMEKWARAGVWIISRGDSVYPKKLKDSLKGLAPNIFFGIGNSELLQQHYVGVVGSRDAEEKDLEIAMELGRRAKEIGVGIISGGAKGVDEAAMSGVLSTGGLCTGILADSLIKKSTTQAYRNYILDGKLVLLSPFNPEAGFNAGNAMSRNKVIYALSKATIVVKSDIKGGTWEGAKENLKNQWVPLWVCSSPEKGNNEIVRLGGTWLGNYQNFQLSELESNRTTVQGESTLFPLGGDDVKRIPYAIEPVAMSVHEPSINRLATFIDRSSEPSDLKGTFQNATELDMFQFFLIKWQVHFGDKLVSRIELADGLQILPKQVDKWLEMGMRAELLFSEKKGNVKIWSIVRNTRLLV